MNTKVPKAKPDLGRYCITVRMVTRVVHQDCVTYCRGGRETGTPEQSKQAQEHGTRVSPFCDTGPTVPLATLPTVGAAR